MTQSFYLIILMASLYDHRVVGTIQEFCKTTEKFSEAYNMGPNVFVSDGRYNIWQFDPESYLMQKLKLEDIYPKDSFEWVQTAFRFNFKRCAGNNSSNYCHMISKAIKIRVAIGKKSRSSQQSYITCHRIDGELSPIADANESIWDLKSRSTLKDNFWIPVTPKESNLFYNSTVFVPNRSELIAQVYVINQSKYRLMSKTLKSSGNWSQWREIDSDIKYRGMFQAKDRVFGMDTNNIMHEFIWNKNKLSLKRISSVKEFFNCYENTTLKLEEKKNLTNSPLVITDNSNNDQMSSGLPTFESETNEDYSEPVNDLLITSTNSTGKSNQKSLVLPISILIVIMLIVSGICLTLWFCFHRNKSLTYDNSNSSDDITLTSSTPLTAKDTIISSTAIGKPSPINKVKRTETKQSVKPHNTSKANLISNNNAKLVSNATNKKLK